MSIKTDGDRSLGPRPHSGMLRLTALVVVGAFTGSAVGYIPFAKDHLVRIMLGVSAVAETVIFGVMLAAPSRVRQLPVRTLYMAAFCALFFGSLIIVYIAGDRGAFIEPIRDYRGDFDDPRGPKARGSNE